MKVPACLRRRWWIVAGLVVTASAGWWLAHYFRGPRVTELWEHLPEGDPIIVFLDVERMRQSGLLEAVAGRPEVQENEYRKFVQATGFDYRTDLDTVLAAFYKEEVFILARGRFDWARLERYVTDHGGTCTQGFCRMQGSIPGRYISFCPLAPGVMAFASSADPWGARALQSKHRSLDRARLPQAPFWIRASAARIRESDRLPLGTRLFARALVGVDVLTFTVGPGVGGLEARLIAECRSEQAAAGLVQNFRDTTELLRSLLARERKQPNPRDLTGVLVSGEFWTEGTRMVGRWKVPKEFLESLAQG